MDNKRKTKFEDDDFMGFRCERVHKSAFTTFCDENNFNESAVLRRMLIEFLKEKGVDLDDIKDK